LVLVCAAALSIIAVPLVTTRDVEFHIRLENAGPAWMVDWASGAGRNGHWIDLAERLGPASSFSTARDRMLIVRERIPRYVKSAVSLHWQDSPGARLTIDDAFIDQGALGALRQRTKLSVAGRAGETFPFYVTCTQSGGVDFTCPPAPARAIPLSLPRASFS